MKNIRFFVFSLLCLSAMFANGQGEIYDKYAARETLNVAYVEGYRIDSANRVDVILIIAQDSSTWDSLLVEFNMMPEDEQGQQWKKEHHSKMIACRSIKDPTQPSQPTDKSKCLMSVDFHRRNICIFFLTDYDRQFGIIAKQSLIKAKQDEKERIEN